MNINVNNNNKTYKYFKNVDRYRSNRIIRKIKYKSFIFNADIEIAIKKITLEMHLNIRISSTIFTKSTEFFTVQTY